jgi:hypothetical protein
MMAVHELFLSGFLSIYPEGEEEKQNKKNGCKSSRAICPSEGTVGMNTDLHLLQDLTVAPSSSRDVGLSSNADRRHKVSGARSTTLPFPRASSVVRLLIVPLMAKILCH